jgi:hypothetical protein
MDMVLAAIICAAVGVTLLAFAVAWLVGWIPAAEGSPAYASAREARERATDLAAEFWDWLKLGR